MIFIFSRNFDPGLLYSRNISSVCLLLFMLCGNVPTFAQFDQYKVDIFVDKDKLDFGLVGGLSSPQFSEVDFNNDGIQDLYIFESTAGKSLTFINNGTADEVDYTYAPFYERFFPELKNWVLLRDYNGDGIQDIFTFSDVPGVAGAKVYTGKYVNNTINFERLDFSHIISNNLIPVPAGNGVTQLYITGQDYPAIDDIDLDGDLDILAPGVLGGYTYFYQNRSIELGFGLDSLIFEIEDECWGKFYETPQDPIIDLSNDINECSEGFHGDNSASRHPGTTLLTLDIDGDTDRDLLIGVVSLNNLSLLTNGGNTDTAFMTDQIVYYPNNFTPVDIQQNPASFYLDIDNDQVKELIVSPNQTFGIESVQVAWLYENSGTTDNPLFQFVQKDWLVGEMLDMGKDANPTFVDYNADGLLDLVVGNGTFYAPQGNNFSRIHLYENIGTADNPMFELVDSDYLQMSIFDGTASRSFSPTFGDIDMDGDMDVIIGEDQGQLYFGENIAGPGNPIEIQTLQYNYSGIDLGGFAKPQIIDLNRDGKMDIVVGEKVGRMVYFENVGTATEPEFLPNLSQSEPAGNNIIFLGQVDTRFGESSGYAAPFFVDFVDSFALFIGTLDGRIMHYGNIDNNLDGAFTLIDDSYGDVFPGYQSTPALVDLNNDGRLEMFSGSIRGGLTAYKSNFFTDGSPVSTVDFDDAKRIRIQPNPVDDYTNLVMEGNWRNASYQVFNAVGQLIQSSAVLAAPEKINTQDWTPGIYILQVQIDGKFITEKVVVR